MMPGLPIWAMPVGAVVAVLLFMGVVLAKFLFAPSAVIQALRSNPPHKHEGDTQ